MSRTNQEGASRGLFIGVVSCYFLAAIVTLAAGFTFKPTIEKKLNVSSPLAIFFIFLACYLVMPCATAVGCIYGQWAGGRVGSDDSDEDNSAERATFANQV